MNWPTVKARPILDPSSGNLNIHGRSGLTISYREQSCGIFLNLSGRSLFFEIAGQDRFQLTAGSDLTEQLIEITAEIIAGLTLNATTPFCVRDERDEDAPFVTWAGQIRTYGFNAEPSDG